jgi:hypothetical protein
MYAAIGRRSNALSGHYRKSESVKVRPKYMHRSVDLMEIPVFLHSGWIDGHPDGALRLRVLYAQQVNLLQQRTNTTREGQKQTSKKAGAVTMSRPRPDL